MDVTAVATLLRAAALPDEAACRAELAAVKVVRGVLDARELEIVRRLDELAATHAGLFPQEVVATTSNTSLAAAERLRERAEACAAIPELGAALSAGATSGDRVDIVVRATAGLSPAQRARLAGHGARLALAAGTQSATTFRKTVDDVLRKVRDDDGLGRLARQRRMARLRWWIDGDGMWNLAGRVDPATGARMEGRLRNEIDRIRTAGLPDTCPTDTLERHQHLAALALTSLLGLRDTGTGGGGTGPSTGTGAAGADHPMPAQNPPDPLTPTARPPSGTPAPTAPIPPTGAAPASSPRPAGGGAPDVTVLIDIQTLLDGHTHDGTILDIGLAHYGLPIETIRRWACLGTITPVITAEHGTRLLLGRETRLANRAQRRALRILHPTCMLCDVPFDNCQIHHITWYTLGGPTDITNLGPLCDPHHHLVHEGGWTLHLAPDRTLTITRPDGTTTIHGPPQTPAA